MTAIIIPSRWTRQPQHPAEFTGGLIAPDHLWTPDGGRMRDHCGGFHAYSAEFTAALRAGVGGIGVQSTSGTYGYGFKTGSKSTADPWLDAGEYTVFGVADLDALQGSFQHVIRIDRDGVSYAGALDLGVKQNGANVQMAPLLYTSATQGWNVSSFLDIKPVADFKPGPSLYIFRWKSSAHLQCAITPLGHKNQWVSHTYLPSNIAYQIENDMFAHIGGLGYPGELAWSGHIYMVGLLPYSISDAAADALAKNPWQIFRKAPRILYFDVGGGPAAHASSGILTGPGSVIAGTGANLYEHQSSGALTGPGSVVVGTGTNAAPGAHDTLGALVGPGSSIAGTGAVANLHTTSGILVGPGAIITGTGSVTGVHASSGVLVGPGATIAGVGTVVGATTLTAADLAAIWGYEIEPGITALQALRILLAAVGGKRVGLGTATEYYMAQDGVTPRITFSPTDTAGNGTPTVDGS